MKILHLTSHLGGGIGTVILNWIRADKDNDHMVICFEDQKTQRYCTDVLVAFSFDEDSIFEFMEYADICIIHLFEHPKAVTFLGWCRFWGERPPIIAWIHKKYTLTSMERIIPDYLVATSPVIDNYDEVIWSTGGVDKYLKVKPKKHDGFNIGYIGTIDNKKMHPDFFEMANKMDIPDIKVHMVGHVGEVDYRIADPKRFVWHGWLDDVRPVLEILDVFFYPLVRNGYGTCEQVLGESMAAGVTPVVLNNTTEMSIVDSEINGLVCMDEDSMVKAVEYLYQNEEERKTLSDNARKKAKDLYSMRKMIQKWNRLFKKIVRE